MGKGDKKTRRGKIAMGSYGVRRPRPANKTNEASGGSAEAKKKEAAKKK